MTYANDCIHERRRGLKRIEEHSSQELNAAISVAVQRYGEEFWVLLYGIDAYMERRRRRKLRHENRILRDIFDSELWGDR